MGDQKHAAQTDFLGVVQKIVLVLASLGATQTSVWFIYSQLSGAQLWKAG